MQKETQLKSCYKKSLSSPNTHHSSSRSVSMRDIVAGVPNASLYPAFARAASTGMTSEASVGFTLIELLVVVLIIGILAAVALPQYQKAVEKSKGVQAITLIKSMANAVTLYHLANGEWPASLDVLDIEIPSSWTGTEHVIGVTQGEYHSNNDWSLQWETASSKYLRIERLQGPYRGASFQWTVNSIPEFQQQIICIELSSAITPAGKYCEKLFRGTLKESGDVRAYTLP